MPRTSVHIPLYTNRHGSSRNPNFLASSKFCWGIHDSDLTVRAFLRDLIAYISWGIDVVEKYGHEISGSMEEMSFPTCALVVMAKMSPDIAEIFRSVDHRREVVIITSAFAIFCGVAA